MPAQTFIVEMVAAEQTTNISILRTTIDHLSPDLPLRNITSNHRYRTNPSENPYLTSVNATQLNLY